MPLTLEIVTPEARVYSDVIETVVIPTVEGEIGILPGHIPLLTQVEAGELRVSKNGRTEYLAVGNGFAEVDGDKVSVLAESAIDEARIDEDAVAKAQADQERALMLATLRHYNHHKERVAAVLGISLKTLYNRLKEYTAEAESERSNP